MKKFIVLLAMYITHVVANLNSSYNNSTCGIISESRPLIQGGQLSNREQFSWLVNIFTKPTRDFGTYLYAGSGTLITDRHVVCAANSVAYENYLEDESNTLDPERPYIAYSGKNIKLKLGTKNYKDSINEPDALVINTVQKVKLHPHLRGNKPRIANIAILRVRQAIVFTQFIQPACVWSSELQQENQNSLLYAVGHGLDQTGTLSFMRKHVLMTMQSDEICKRFFKNTFKSENFFCAKGNGLETPCRHDKMLYQKINGQWHLRALSSMFKLFRNNTCSLNAPVLYEDISPYSHWILESTV